MNNKKLNEYIDLLEEGILVLEKEEESIEGKYSVSSRIVDILTRDFPLLFKNELLIDQEYADWLRSFFMRFAECLFILKFEDLIWILSGHPRTPEDTLH